MAKTYLVKWRNSNHENNVSRNADKNCQMFCMFYMVVYIGFAIADGVLKTAPRF